MKVKYLWVILLSLTFFGCDDNTGTLGLGMFPGGDQNINGKLATFDVQRQASAIWENSPIRISAIMRLIFWHNYIVMKTLPFRRFIIKITQTIPKRSW